MTDKVAFAAEEVAALWEPLVPVCSAGAAEVVYASIPPELVVDAFGTVCIVAQHAGQGRCWCNWDELHDIAAAMLAG